MQLYHSFLSIILYKCAISVINICEKYAVHCTVIVNIWISEILFNGIWRLENFVAIGLPIESYLLQLIKISNHNRIISYFLMPTFMTAYKDRDRIKNAMKDLNSNL